MFLRTSLVRTRQALQARRATPALAVLTVLGLVAGAAAPARALSSRPVRHERVPSIVVRTERNAGTVASTKFSEQLDVVEVRGLRNAATQARVNGALAGYTSSARTTFESGLTTWNGSPNDPPLQLTISAISTYTSKTLTSVVFQSTVEGSVLAHPFSHFDALTFDFQGRSLSLSQLVQPGAVDRLARAASPFVTWTLNARGNPGCNGDPATITRALVPAPGADQPAAHVGFTRSGLLVAFDDYSFAYYACGYVTVTIPYTALGNVIRPDLLASVRHGDRDRPDRLVADR